jgi:hypothetical protein
MALKWGKPCWKASYPARQIGTNHGRQFAGFLFQGHLDWLAVANAK